MSRRRDPAPAGDGTVSWRTRLIAEHPDGRRVIAEQLIEGDPAQVARAQLLARLLPELDGDPTQLVGAARPLAPLAAGPAATSCVAVRLGGAAGVEVMRHHCIHRDAYDVVVVEHGPDCRWCARAWDGSRGLEGRIARQRGETLREPTCRRCDQARR